jgi:hypothetical protein
MSDVMYGHESQAIDPFTLWWKDVFALEDYLKTTEVEVEEDGSKMKLLLELMEKGFLSQTTGAFSSLLEFVTHDVQTLNWPERSEEVEKLKASFEAILQDAKIHKEGIEGQINEVHASLC